MSFFYFAYGSNLWPAQMCGRCASARSVGRGTIRDWRVVYDKPGADGTAKANLRESTGSEVQGVVYELDASDRPALDRAEPNYTPLTVEAVLDDGRVVEALSYRFTSEGTDDLPADWYVSLVTSGAARHGLSDRYVSSSLSSRSRPEPGLSGLVPADADDLPEMQQILSMALSAETRRYTIHPGDFAWWVWHDDPRYANRVSYWMIPGEVVLVIEEASDEISVFGAPGRARAPVIEWAQRRFGGNGVVAWVADSDSELVDYLKDNAYEPDHVYRWYHWDLEAVAVPEPVFPEGWELRSLAGEYEADERRRASHAAFQSTMAPDMHLNRYLRFMRSPIYDRSRDLVAVSPEGRIASFMVWWPDPSGIAQIEPFGTRPEFQGRGLGKALVHHGLRTMSEAGMTLARVITDEPRTEANAFYQSVGFEEAGWLRWWRKAT